MANIQRKRVFRLIVSMDNFVSSISDALKKTWGVKGGVQKRSLLPTLIGIEVITDIRPSSIKVVRTFFRKLRAVHQRHFVRFVTDLLWAMESDSGDIFYTHDGSKAGICDVVWTVKIINENYVEVETTVPIADPDQILYRDLCRSLEPSVNGIQGPVTDDAFCQIIHDFHKNTETVSKIESLNRNFHILLVPDRLCHHYYPIPLHGISHADAERRYNKATREMLFLQKKHHEIFPPDLETKVLIRLLMDMVNDVESYGVRKRTAVETYALAELLFGGVTAHSEDIQKTDHGIILFNVVGPDSKVDYYRLPISGTAEKG